MSGTGIVATPAGIGGTFDPKRTNFYCNSCRSFVQAPPGTSSMRECPTPGCTDPYGFGIYWKTP
jgi:LSD1 subclass zinc finger protein